MTDNMPASVIVNVKGCSACGNDHDNMYFDLLHRPKIVRINRKREVFYYAAHCPDNGGKVYMNTIEEAA